MGKSEDKEWFPASYKTPNERLGQGVEGKVEEPVREPHYPTSDFE